MKLRKTLAAAGALAIAGSMISTLPASAGAGDFVSTEVTFTIDPGDFTIAVDNTAVAPLDVVMLVTGGATITGDLGATTVSDSRVGVANIATVTATSLGFDSDQDIDTDPDDIAADNAVATNDLLALAGEATDGDGMVLTPAFAVAGTDLAAGIALLSTTTTGSGTVTYTPGITINLDAAEAVAGTYTGSVVQTLT